MDSEEETKKKKRTNAEIFIPFKTITNVWIKYFEKLIGDGVFRFLWFSVQYLYCVCRKIACF